MNRPTSKLISLLFSAGVMASTVLLSSCGKDDDESIRPKVEIPTEFSELTVEQNKAKLEDNGIAMINKLTSLKNTAGIKSTISFNHFLDVAALPNGKSKVTDNKAVQMIVLLSKFGIGNAKASEVLKGFRTKEEDPGTAQELFDNFKGTYTYNATTEEWAFVAGGDKITFKFPSTEGGTTNNAELSIYGYASQNVTNETADYVGDVPTALKADLTVGGTKQIEYSWAASYKANGEPTSIKTSLTIGTFKFTYEVKNTTSEVSVDYSLTESGANILSFGAGASGNFSSDKLGEAEGAGDVVTSGSSYFQIMNIKFAGEVKVKTLEAALDAATTLTQEAAAYNANVTFVVFYADSKKKIANAQFYAKAATPNDEAALDIRLIFADGSPTNLDVYTEVGFEDVEAKWNEFLDQLDADLG